MDALVDITKAYKNVTIMSHILTNAATNLGIHSGDEHFDCKYIRGY